MAKCAHSSFPELAIHPTVNSELWSTYRGAYLRSEYRLPVCCELGTAANRHPPTISSTQKLIWAQRGHNVGTVPNLANLGSAKCLI